MTGSLKAEELLAGLTPAQRSAVTSEAAPLCILASAGAGKTRVLTRRIAYRAAVGAADARHTLAITFTRKAASELHSRLLALGLREQVAAGTFHAQASAQLHTWWADRRQSPLALLERKSRLLGPLVSGRPGLGKAPLAELAGHIEWAKARTVAPEALEEALEKAERSLPAGVSPRALASLYARYEHEKRRRGLVDFDDLLARCAEAIERDPEFAGAQRWRWRHVYVDEFQDLNPLQHRLLLAWLGTSTDLCVVGDPHQAIYGWNGADPGLLHEVPRRWPTTEVVHLDANHRCTEQIVRAAAAVLGPTGSRLQAAGRTGPVPRISSYPSEAAEARGIAAGVLRAGAQGRRWSAMAVLTRTNAQLAAVEEALTAAGVPWWSPARAMLLEDPVVAEALDGFRRQGHQPVRAVIADLRELAASLPGGPGPGTSTPVEELAEMASSFESIRPGGSVSDWLRWLPLVLRDRSGGSGREGAVALSSFHRAKGLEWDFVWVAGLEEGLVPIGRPVSEEAEAEERRLLYVAITRAGEELHLSWAQSRSFGGRAVPRQPSRWVEPIAHAAEPSGEPLGTDTWRRRLAGQREDLRRTAAGTRPVGRRTPAHWPEPDRHVQGALRSWRLETARATGVPPYALLHDVTLEALAALRPASMDELLAVPGLGPVKAARYGPSLLAIVSGEAASA